MLVKPLVRPICRAIAGRPTASLGTGFAPTSLFADGSIGVLYDNNDLTTMFVDAAGTTPATVNGLVGLQLDKSQGLALGAEIRSSGAIGLVGTATAATYNTSTGVGSVTRVDASNQSFVQFFPVSATSFYRIDISNTGANDLGVRSGSGGPGGVVWHTVPAGQSAVVYVLAIDGYITITARPSGASSTTFTLNSIKLASGNHRYQTTTGFKPVLRGTPTGAELFTAYGTPGAGWSVAGATGTATTASSALPTTTAATVGKHYRVTYTVTRSAGSVQLSFGGRTGVSRSAAGQYVEYFDNALNTNALTATGTGFTGTVRIDEVKDVSAGSVTAPYGLQYDGVDDFLQTASVNFSATDKITAIAGGRTFPVTANGTFVELGNSSTTSGSFAIGIDSAAGNAFLLRGFGTATGAVFEPSGTVPRTSVVSGLFDISQATTATEMVLRVNGVVSASIPLGGPLGTGNFGNHILYFGRRAGTSQPFSGLDFGFVIVGKTLTAAQISSTERYIAQRTGVSI